MTKLKSAAAAAVFASSLVFVSGISQAAPISSSAFVGAQAGTSHAAPLIDVRYRHRHRHRHRYYGHYHHNNGGAVAAGAILGLAAGAIAAGAANGNAVDYCLQRFRSYDVASGTYLGYDGYRHPCP